MTRGFRAGFATIWTQVVPSRMAGPAASSVARPVLTDSRCGVREGLTIGRDGTPGAVRLSDYGPLSDSKRPAKRPLLIRAGKRLRGFFDRIIGASSLVSNAPLLDVREFA